MFFHTKWFAEDFAVLSKLCTVLPGPAAGFGAKYTL